MVLDAEREASSLRARSQGWAGLAGRAVDRVLIAVKLHPDALRNRLSGKPKGHWIAYLRSFRGLPPSPDSLRRE